MTALWFILAGMTAAAVLTLLWPMSRRRNVPPEGDGAATEAAFYEDQLAEIERDLARGLIAPEEAEAARTEAARRLLRAGRAAPGEASPALAEPRLRRRRAASAFALSTIPLVALLVYGVYGSPDLPAQTEADRQAARSGSDDLIKAVGQIEARLARDPDDARGWAVLAPVYMRMARFADAAKAYAALARLKGETAETLADWGEALTAADNGTVPPEAKAVFERALARDPKLPKAHFYLARAAEQAGDTGEAIRLLAELESGSPADAPWMKLVRETLARLRGEPLPASPPASSPASPPATADAGAAAPRSLPPGQQAMIRGMVDGLDARLTEAGGTPEEWLRLVRSRLVLGDRAAAGTALARARAALAADPAALASLEAGARDLGLASEGARDAGAPQSPAAGSPGAAAARADTESAVAAIRAMPQAERDVAIRGMVEGLDRRLAAKGGSADEWARLVRSYAALGERDRAAEVLSRARMALVADAAAAAHLDALGRELDLSRAP